MKKTCISTVFFRSDAQNWGYEILKREREGGVGGATDSGGVNGGTCHGVIAETLLPSKAQAGRNKHVAGFIKVAA